MLLFDIAWSTIGIISFVIFLILYKKLKTSPFFGKSHPSEAWAICQVVFAAPRIGTLFLGWTQNRPVYYSPLLHIVVYLTTGIIMITLARKEKMTTLNHGLTKDINEQVEKLDIK